MAYNIVGPALPQALRVIRFPLVNLDGTLRDEKEDPDTLATTLPEEHSPSIITAEEQQVLQENSTVVETLEDIYSLTCVIHLSYLHHMNSLFMVYSQQPQRPHLNNKCPHAGRIVALPTRYVSDLALLQHFSGEPLHVGGY